MIVFVLRICAHVFLDARLAANLMILPDITSKHATVYWIVRLDLEKPDRRKRKENFVLRRSSIVRAEKTMTPGRKILGCRQDTYLGSRPCGA